VLEVDQSAEVTRRYSEQDVADYVALGGAQPHTGDVPEPMIGALFSYLLGVKLPGIGTNYLKQESEYLQTPRVGEELTARVRITRVRPEKHLIDLETNCYNEQGASVCNGRALVYIADVRT
jgi:acyl dehydratase